MKVIKITFVSLNLSIHLTNYIYKIISIIIRLSEIKSYKKFFF